MFADTPAIALVTSEQWNQLCAYAQAHDIEQGHTEDDCFAECYGTIQVCHIRSDQSGPHRMGLTRTAYSVEELTDTQLEHATLSPEMSQKLTSPSETPFLVVHVLDATNPTPEEELAAMPIAEATRYFYEFFQRATGAPYV